MNKYTEKIYRNIAWKFPFKRLQYFLAVDLIAQVTTGEYSKTVVPELTAMEALKRFGDKYSI